MAIQWVRIPILTMLLKYILLSFALRLTFLTTILIRTEPTKGCIPMNTGVTRIQFTNTTDVHDYTPE